MTAIGIIGHLARDVVAGAAPRVGGTVYYGARAAARLGAPARIVARCAPADRALLLAPLERLGLPVTWHTTTASTGFSFHYEGDHRVMAVDAIGDPWTADDMRTWVADALGDATWVQVGALLRTDFGPASLAALAGQRRRLLVDGQGLVRAAVTGQLRRDRDVERSVLGSLQVLKLNESEATILAGGTDPERLRGLGVPEVLVTFGSRGSAVVTATGDWRVAAASSEPVQDPTGAGDGYSTAYLAARSAGAEPAAAGEQAAAFVATLLSGR